MMARSDSVADCSYVERLVDQKMVWYGSRMAREAGSWWSYLGPFEWPVWAAFVLLGHVLLSTFLITLIWLADRWTRVLYGPKLPLIWDFFPFEYIFQTMDLGVLAVFLVRGLQAAWRELGKQGTNV
jgi:hypothetical protein